MGSRDEEVRSWKLQTINRPAVAVVLSRLIDTLAYVRSTTEVTSQAECMRASLPIAVTRARSADGMAA